MKKNILIFLSTIYYLLSTITPVYAGSSTLSISPPVVEIMIAPGKAINQTFNLQYQGDEATIIPELHKIKPSDSFGHVAIESKPLDPATIPLIITSITHPLGKEIVSTGGTLPVTLSFQAAATGTETDVYLALVLRAVGINEIQNASITTPAISALILITINPTIVSPVDIAINDFSPPQLHDSWVPLVINPKIENKTSIMTRTEGKYEVISPFGKTIFSAPLYPNLVLGNSSRSIQSSVHELPFDLSWSPSWREMGPHKLRLTITTLGSTKLSEIERIVWILPIRLLIILITLIIFIIALLKTALKKNATIKTSLT